LLFSNKSKKKEGDDLEYLICLCSISSQAQASYRTRQRWTVRTTSIVCVKARSPSSSYRYRHVHFAGDKRFTACFCSLSCPNSSVMFLFSCWKWSYGLIMNYYYTGLPCKLQANIHLIFALGFALAKYIETFTTAVQPGEISCFSSDFSCNVKAHTETKKKKPCKQPRRK
jgi:hypothetical protein